MSRPLSVGDSAFRRLHRTFTLLAATVLLAVSPVASGEPEFKVGFLAGGDRENNFWVRMGEFARAVAEDLNIDLEVVYPPPATYVIKRKGESLVNSLDENAYFVTVYFDAVTGDLLKAAEANKVDTFIINADVLEQEQKTVGVPRSKLEHWIGHMRPDDVQAGYRVADQLFKHFDNPENVRMIGLNGDPSVQVAADRQAGLKQRFNESPRAKLHEVGVADWLQESARVRTGELLKQYPDTNAIWAASDPMALGAIQAIKEAGKRPGEDIVAASIDWTNEGLKAIESGELLASIGGHFMEAGIALLLIYDYHHGNDFAGELGVSFKTPMYPVTVDNIDRYFDKVGTNPDWSSIDFKQFTKTHNPDLDRYDFSWPAIIEQLQ